MRPWSILAPLLLLTAFVGCATRRADPAATAPATAATPRTTAAPPSPAPRTAPPRPAPAPEPSAVATAAPAASPPNLPWRAPATDLDGIDDAARAAIARGDVPGAVILVVRDGGVVFERAYGLRSVRPVRRPMTVDTVFDLASLTKPIATAAAVALLAQEGKLSPDDAVSRHLPGFEQAGKEAITVAQLLRHTSGLPAANPLHEYAGGPERALAQLLALPPSRSPGERFEYSDVGYITLGALVERVSGEPLARFAQRRLFEPLGMRDTGFFPDEALAARAAPTVERGGRFLQGRVHDPRAARLGGAAGHAGLFSTAEDLARFAVMLMRGGALGGARVFDEAAVARMTTGQPLPRNAGLRGLGWDVDTEYSGARGDLPEGFGHTGFTGTSLWVAPAQKTAVIVLSSRLHPDGEGDARKLRRDVADVVARSLATRGATAGRAPRTPMDIE